MAQTIYDYIVVGSGLGGLIVSSVLSKSPQVKVALIEASEEFGGVHHAKNKLPIGLRFIADTAEARIGLQFLEALLEQPLILKGFEQQPVTYHSGEFKTFLGFGDHPPDFYEAINYFLNPKQLQLTMDLGHLCAELFKIFKGDFFPRSYVTQFKVQEGQVSSVLINGTKTLYAKQFIYTGSLRDLGLLLPEAVLNSRLKNKLLKGPYWTAVHLDLEHTHNFPESFSTAVHMLNGTTEDEIGPCIGRIASKNESQWLTFVDQESSEDPEIIAAALKKIKRQIKRAYPLAFEGSPKEKILVYPYYSGFSDFKLDSKLRPFQLSNFWTVHSSLLNGHNIPGLHQHLLQAYPYFSEEKFDSCSINPPVLIEPTL